MLTERQIRGNGMAAGLGATATTALGIGAKREEAEVTVTGTAKGLHPDTYLGASATVGSATLIFALIWALCGKFTERAPTE